MVAPMSASGKLRRPQDRAAQIRFANAGWGHRLWRGRSPARSENPGGKMKARLRCVKTPALWCAGMMMVLGMGNAAKAQDGYQMEVIQANHQDESQPLKNIAPLAPDSKREREHPLHPIHPLQANGTPPPDGALQENANQAIATSAGLNFEGLGQGAYGFSPDAAPPDTNASVGDTQVVEWVNESF